MTATSDLHTAIVAVWNDGLDTTFKTYWEAADKTVYLTLNEGEATPGTPAPYCVFEQIRDSTVTRMSGISDTDHSLKQMLRETGFYFRIHAVSTSDLSAKAVAAALLDAVLQSYGGHPTVEPKRELLCAGGVLNMQYRDDYPMRMGDNEYQWTIEYAVTVDKSYR